MVSVLVVIVCIPPFKNFSIKIHPKQVFSAVETLEQIALQVPAIDRFPNHFLLLLVPHRIFQHIFHHTQRPQFSGTHRAQIGAVIAAVGAPVFLLPAGVAGSAVDELVQLFRIVHTIIHREIVLEAAVIFPGRLAAGDTLRAQMLNILHSVKGGCIENMSRLAAAVADNAIWGLLKSAGFQRGGVIPEGGQAQLGLPLLLFLFFLRRFWPGEGIVVAPAA